MHLDQPAPPYEFASEQGPDSPAPMLHALIADYPEFADLREGEARVVAILYDKEVTIQGRVALAYTALPRVQGRLSPFFGWLLARELHREPDFLIFFDRWHWAGSDRRTREIICFHELCHCAWKRDADNERKFTPEGDPVWMIKGHDVESFHAEVRRYGAWNEELRDFLVAAAEGERGKNA